MADEPKETLSERLQRERTERKLELEARKFSERKVDKENFGPPQRSRVTSSRRQEKLERQYNKVEPAITPRNAPAVNSSESSPVYFYMWKDGKIHEVAVLCQSQPNELP